MRRMATCLTLCVFSLLNVGCKNGEAGSLFGWGKDRSTPAADPYQASADTPEEPVSYPVYNQPVLADNAYAPSRDTVEAPVAPVLAASSAATRYHTVAKRDTLYAIARTYYGDQRRWKDIYEANRADISDPNRIRVGQRLLIP